jgi:hypothetical protein
MLSTISLIKYQFLCVTFSQIKLEGMKLLKICRQKFCEYQPNFPAP